MSGEFDWRDSAYQHSRFLQQVASMAKPSVRPRKPLPWWRRLLAAVGVR